MPQVADAHLAALENNTAVLADAAESSEAVNIAPQSAAGVSPPLGAALQIGARMQHEKSRLKTATARARALKNFRGEVEDLVGENREGETGQGESGERETSNIQHPTSNVQFPDADGECAMFDSGRENGEREESSPVAHIEHRHENATNASVSLSSLKGGEGRGEEAFRVQGEMVRGARQERENREQGNQEETSPRNLNLPGSASVPLASFNAKERGLQSASTSKNQARDVEAETSNIEHRTPNIEVDSGKFDTAIEPTMVGRVTPCAPERDQSERSSKFKSRDHLTPLPRERAGARGIEAHSSNTAIHSPEALR